MKAVITVIGKDMVGILAKVSERCMNYNVNISTVSQSILGDLFAMVMVVEVDKINREFSVFIKDMEQLGAENALVIKVMHEDIFNSMHRI